MKKSLIALVLLAGCGGCGGSGDSGNASGGNAAAPAAGSDEAANREARGAAGRAVETAGLTGLYEAGSGTQRSQLCILDKGTGNAQFGLNIWGRNATACSGAGSAVRDGDRLTLTMSGDQSCTLRATLRGGVVTLPREVPPGCSYYCGPGASLTGMALARIGTTAADAMKAKDIADDPLCEW